MDRIAETKAHALNRMLDLCAAGLSGLCVVHCLLLPVVVAFLPLAAELTEAEWIHKVLVFMAAPISLLAAWRSLGTSYFPVFAILSALGLALLALAAFLPVTEQQETLMTVAGAITLALSHLWRWTRHKKDCAEACD